jgi:hypothetical protein
MIALGMGAGPALAQPGVTQGVERLSTADLVSICAASAPNAESPLTAFCRGFIIGVGQYHQQVSAASGRPIFCVPNPSPTIEQVQVAFVQWARANEGFGRESAVDGLGRFAQATYPCPPQPAAPARRR